MQGSLEDLGDFWVGLAVWVKTNGGAPPISEPILVGIGMFTGYGILTHGQLRMDHCAAKNKSLDGQMAFGCSAIDSTRARFPCTIPLLILKKGLGMLYLNLARQLASFVKWQSGFEPSPNSRPDGIDDFRSISPTCLIRPKAGLESFQHHLA